MRAAPGENLTKEKLRHMPLLRDRAKTGLRHRGRPQSGHSSLSTCPGTSRSAASEVMPQFSSGPRACQTPSIPVAAMVARMYLARSAACRGLPKIAVLQPDYFLSKSIIVGKGFTFRYLFRPPSVQIPVTCHIDTHLIDIASSSRSYSMGLPLLFLALLDVELARGSV